jgi:hypothetical protein
MFLQIVSKEIQQLESYIDRRAYNEFSTRSLTLKLHVLNVITLWDVTWEV